MGMLRAVRPLARTRGKRYGLPVSTIDRLVPDHQWVLPADGDIAATLGSRIVRRERNRPQERRRSSGQKCQTR
jgi:hypothetical protein